MARYTGPVCRLCRRFGDKLMLKGERCATPKCPLEKRSVPPGGRSQRRGRTVISDRGLQLREKQKVRFSYGVLERQFRRFFGEAKKAPGTTGENLLILLERRLDNVVCRLGFADSRAQARQIVQHGHLTVNGQKTDIPSFLVKGGDIIKWRDASTKTEYYKRVAEEVEAKLIPNWLSLDKESMTGRVVNLPAKEDIEAGFNEKAVVEYYSR
ncbi:MAG: 30S ribosomal protein S4 [Dehalococcoidia bacterium]|nr:MAG: 30S ribosomal protein S4 [Dehalococcoidia bacterium]